MTKLFKVEQVRKFFNILGRLNGGYSVDESKQIYAGYDKKNPHLVKSQREVFVNRTINKWLSNKYLILYKVSDLGVQYKQYISITTLKYNNDWTIAGYIKVGIIDYVNPYSVQIFGIDGEKYDYNKCISLEGEWCENNDIHSKLLEIITINNVPDKEYIFKAFDMSKYPKRNKKGINPYDLITTTKSFIAKTEYMAYELKRDFEKENKELIISELVHVKFV